MAQRSPSGTGSWYLRFGNIHCAVRWNTVRCSTSSAMVGAIWKPLAPAPTRAKRVPRMSTSGSHRAEWNDGPAKSSMPSMSGIFGWFNEPTALITKRASRVSVAPSGVRTSTAQRPVPSSKVAAVTSVSNRQCSSMPRLVMTRSKYSRSSGCWEKYSVQWSAGSKE